MRNKEIVDDMYIWVLCVILILAAGVYVLWPLFAKNLSESAAAPAETGSDYLIARKTALYRNIRELEFEYSMGRLTEADFRRLDAEYKGEADEVLQKTNALNSSAATPEPDGKADVCSGCGAKTIPGKKFCADCGARLSF